MERRMQKPVLHYVEHGSAVLAVLEDARHALMHDQPALLGSPVEQWRERGRNRR